MTTQTTALTAQGRGAAFSAQPGQSITYSSTGVFTGYLFFKRSRTQGATWETVEAPAVDTNFTGATVKNETNAEERYRVEIYDTDALTPVTGTATTVLTDVNDTVRYLKDDNGKVYGYVTDDGVVFVGDVTVGDALNVTGVATSQVGVEDTLTAHAGGTQAAALALSSTAFYHRISVCATAGDSVILPAATLGKAHYIRNDGAASAQVFGAATETINGVASATGVPLPTGHGAWFLCTTAGKWTTAGAVSPTGSGAHVLATSPSIATPTLTGLVKQTGVENNITAQADGTKANATALSATANWHRISVSAGEGDSVLLPNSSVGQSHFIRNDGANGVQVFGFNTDTINGVATATGVPQGAGSGVFYICVDLGKWLTVSGDELDGKWQVNASGAFLPNSDGVYDIGNGASDPRDINLTRHVYSADVITSSTPGTPAALVTAVEYGDSRVRTTVLTLAAFAVGLSGDNANLARGATLYTFPAGEIIVEGASINVGLTLADAVQTDTPEIGLGTVAAAGEVQATLGAVGATAEDIMEGVAVADVAGTAKVNTDTPTAAVPLVIATAAAHTVCLNVADGWADLTAASAITATGTVVINWRFMS